MTSRRRRVGRLIAAAFAVLVAGSCVAVRMYIYDWWARAMPPGVKVAGVLKRKGSFHFCGGAIYRLEPSMAKAWVGRPAAEVLRELGPGWFETPLPAAARAPDMLWPSVPNGLQCATERFERAEYAAMSDAAERPGSYYRFDPRTERVHLLMPQRGWLVFGFDD